MRKYLTEIAVSFQRPLRDKKQLIEIEDKTRSICNLCLDFIGKVPVPGGVWKLLLIPQSADVLGEHEIQDGIFLLKWPFDQKKISQNSIKEQREYLLAFVLEGLNYFFDFYKIEVKKNKEITEFVNDSEFIMLFHSKAVKRKTKSAKVIIEQGFSEANIFLSISDDDSSKRLQIANTRTDEFIFQEYLSAPTWIDDQTILIERYGEEDAIIEF